MNISGFLKQSFIDYPGKIVSVVFTQGCNFRCPYCHNPELIPVTEGTIPEKVIFAHLEKNRLLLDGIAITGGEPTLQPDLKSFIQRVKESGLLVKLDTNGSNPKLLRNLLDERLLDYVAMDIKSALTETDYALASGIAVSPGKLQQIRQSIQMIINSGVAHEFRTTVCRELVSMENIRAILPELEGAQRYFLQQYRDNEKFEEAKFSAYPKEETEEFLINTDQKVPIFIRY
jgi:pyruvate formate lyase activating enzyme